MVDGDARCNGAQAILEEHPLRVVIENVPCGQGGKGRFDRKLPVPKQFARVIQPCIKVAHQKTAIPHQFPKLP
jgi:hypothetical protein